MMRFLNDIRKNAIITSLLYIVLGVILIIWTKQAISLACGIIGAIIVIKGALNLISYFTQSVEQYNSRFGLISGVICILAGLFIWIRFDIIVSIVPVVFGIIVIAKGISDIQQSLYLKKMDDKSWIFAFVLSVLTLILGVVVLVNPFASGITFFILLGIVLVYQGVSDIFIVMRVSNHIKRAKQEADALIIEEDE